ncbi:sulfotransferase family protein [Marinilabilia salmonicolor]|uniref:sulfotransferase family protein n=1 Tax=Marinilabilia salmonicolor TaxID=989 RepID=UPI0003091C7C|nr:sulfotransferase family protein [Marinilabilia salmonicolor]
MNKKANNQNHKTYNKIFCIGLNKTGTTSLHDAFLKLGIQSVHCNEKNGRHIKPIIKDNYESGNKLLQGIEHYDAYSDWNIPSTNHLFIELDKQYPNSKFILNTRDMNSWIKSREKHVKRIKNLDKLQEKYPDNPWYNIDKNAWEEEFRNHHKKVLDYFANRKDDLIVFDVTNGDSWEKLCNFLNKDIPNKPFPVSNKGNIYLKLNHRFKQLFNNKIKLWIKGKIYKS